MNFQLAEIIAVLSVVGSLSADAYAPTSLVSRSSAAFIKSSRIPKSTNSRLYSQWDEEDEEEATAVTSFQDAKTAIGKEDDQAAMDEMGEFDASGTVSTLSQFAITIPEPRNHFSRS